MSGVERAASFKAGDARHDHVEQDKVGFKLLVTLKAFLARMHCRDLVSFWLEDACQDARIQPVVIDKQDSATSYTRLGRFC